METDFLCSLSESGSCNDYNQNGSATQVRMEKQVNSITKHNHQLSVNCKEERSSSSVTMPREGSNFSLQGANVLKFRYNYSKNTYFQINHSLFLVFLAEILFLFSVCGHSENVYIYWIGIHYETI